MKKLTKSTSLFQISSVSEDSIIATTYKDDLIVRGQGRSVRAVFIVANDAFQNIIIDPSLNPEPIFCLPMIFKTTVGRVDIRLTESANFTYTALGASTLYTVNRFGLIAVIAKTKFYSAPTDVVITGNKLEYTVGQDSTNQSSGGDAFAGQSPFLLLPTKKYLLQFENKSGATTRINWHIDFYENISI